MSQCCFPSTSFFSKFGQTLNFRKNVFVHKILTNDLLFDAIFDACSPATFLRLSCTCRIAHGAVSSYIERIFNVDRILKPYFPDPLAFRSLQRRTGALIAGSTALQFFSRERYPESDIDVYVRKEVREEVCRWVLAQGYTFKSSRRQDKDFEVAIRDMEPETQEHLHATSRYAWIAVDSVFTFVKPDETHPKGAQQVQIVVAKDSPMEVILYFHITVVMNVIAWDSAYCLYPRPTLEKRETLFVRHDLRNTQNFMGKYQRRGYHIDWHLRSPRKQALYAGFAARWIGDGHAWVIRLPPVPESEGARGPTMTRDPCIGTAWQLQGEYTPSVAFETISSVRLRHTYIGCRYHRDIENAILQVVEQAKEGERDGDGDMKKSHDEFLDEKLVQYCNRELALKGQWRTWSGWTRPVW